MKLICKHCGEEFTPPREDVKLLENGSISEITPVCDECFDLIQFSIYEQEFYSDADSGL